MAHGAHSLFLGSHTNKIDKKGRIATPAEFRKNLDTEEFNGFVCVPSLSGPYLDCGGLDLLMRFQAMIDEFPPYGEEREDFEIAIMGRARQLGFDTDGRVLLPQPLRLHAGVEQEACFVGRGSYFQIWNASDVEDRFAQAHERARERRFILNNPRAMTPITNGQSPRADNRQTGEEAL